MFLLEVSCRSVKVVIVEEVSVTVTVVVLKIVTETVVLYMHFTDMKTFVICRSGVA